MFLIGTRLQGLFKKLGFKKPCKACQKRAEKLDGFSRRGILKGIAAGAVAALLFPYRVFAGCVSCFVPCESTLCRGQGFFISCCNSHCISQCVIGPCTECCGEMSWYNICTDQDGNACGCCDGGIC